jgi:hypothetical protein
MAGWRGYRIRVRVDGELDPAWWPGGLDGLVVVPGPDGTTVLTGELRDQAELHGLLGAIRDLGLALVSIETSSVTPTSEGDSR